MVKIIEENWTIELKLNETCFQKLKLIKWCKVDDEHCSFIASSSESMI